MQSGVLKTPWTSRAYTLLHCGHSHRAGETLLQYSLDMENSPVTLTQNA